MADPSFHHLGYVVASVEDALRRFAASLQARWTSALVEDPIQGVKVAFLGPGPSGPLIELVAPLGPSSPVQKLLSKGGGLHHVCYEVDNLEAQIAYAKSTGSVLIRGPRPAVAFNGRRICWVITADRLLVEYLEREGSAG